MHKARHTGTKRCEHRSNQRMRRTPSGPSATRPPPLPPRGARELRKGGGCAPCAGRCPPWGWQQGRDQPTAYGTVHVVRRCETLVRAGQAGGTGVGALKGHPGATQPHRTQEPHQEGRRRAQQARRRGAARQGGGNQDSRGYGRACAWEAATIKGMAWPASPIATGCQDPCSPGILNWHQVGGVSRSPDGLFAQQEEEPTRGRPAVRGKGTCGGRPGQRVEKQGTWASRTQKHREAGYGQPEDGGVWTAKTVKRPRNNQYNLNTPTTGRH